MDEELRLDVDASVDGADDKLDRLVGMLEGLERSLSGVTSSLSNFAKGFDTVAARMIKRLLERRKQVPLLRN